MRHYALLAIACIVVACGDDEEPRNNDVESIPRLKGVNLAVAEFGFDHIPGVLGTDYDYPTNDEVDYFFGKGMNIIRLPFLIERVQLTVNGAVDMSGLDPIVSYITQSGYALLDPHNYGRRDGLLYGSAQLPASSLADFWGKVAAHYKNNPRVIFGLMNEPHDETAEFWLPVAQASIDAIRATGAANLISVPGVQYTGAWCWRDFSDAMSAIEDDNFVFEMHQYFNDDYSGATDTCTHGAETLHAATDWLASHGKKALLTEFGGPNNAPCLASLHDALDFTESHTDQWLGWTYWAAGPWWGDYSFSIEPNPDGSDKPQMSVLEPFLD